MNKLARFFTLLAISVSSVAQGQRQPTPILRIGLVADIQYADVKTQGTRYYRNSLGKLKVCVEDFNKQKVQFSLNLGDVIDRNHKDLDSVLPILKQLKKPMYITPGNHDYKEVTENSLLYAKLGMPAEYYSFERKGWLFIMLNTNEVSAYSNIQGTWKEKELKAIMDSIAASKGVNGADYNGGISSKQLKWVDSLLAQAQNKHQKVFIFSHHPLDFSRGFTALNNKQILQTIDKYTCVKALFAGHHHTGDFGTHLSIPCITLEGMVETSDKNAYGILELYRDKFVLTGYGRVTSRVFHF